MNYLVINKPSNLITAVITSSYTPTPTKITDFIPTTEDDLKAYYKLLKKLEAGQCVDLGALLNQKTKYRDKRIVVKKSPQALDRLSVSELAIHKDDALQLVKQGKSLEFVAYVLSCSESAVLHLTGLDRTAFGDDSNQVSREVQHMLDERKRKREASKVS